MPRYGALLLLLFFLIPTLCLSAQEAAPPPTPTITVQSQLVLVPTEVRTRKGETIYGLHANDFLLEADGIPQQVRLDETEDAQPFSLVVLVQCSRDAWREADRIKGLPAMVDGMVGAAPARVAIVDFGQELELLTGLTSDPDRETAAFARLQPCPEDTGAGIYDALSYANRLLDRDHAAGRRIILLISETRDHGSLAKPAAVIEALNRSNTMVESVAFSPGRDALLEDARTGDGASGSIIGWLGMALQALRKNAAKEFAHETGGEYVNFGSQNKFDRSLNTLTNRVHNAYRLSFVPHFPPNADPNQSPLHILSVHLPKYPDAVLQHRANYWATPVSTQP